ncbi:hypothetical protein ACW14Y_05010 [Kitasatospora sp. cg17-2]
MALTSTTVGSPYLISDVSAARDQSWVIDLRAPARYQRLPRRHARRPERRTESDLRPRDPGRAGPRPDHGAVRPPDPLNLTKESAITSSSTAPETNIARHFASAHYMAIVGTVSTAATAAVCAVLGLRLLGLTLALTCGQQIALQIKLQRLQSAVVAATITARMVQQRGPSDQ